jgi:hypothetical protein
MAGKGGERRVESGGRKRVEFKTVFRKQTRIKQTDAATTHSK